MLQSFRDTIMGWVGYIIVGLIIVVFALWGVQSYLGTSNSPPVVNINGTDVSQIEFQNALIGRQQSLRQIYGDIPASTIESPEFRQSVLDNLIRNKLVTEAAEERGYRISDQMLVDRIQSNPAFQNNGVFSKEKYEQALSGQRSSKTNYESNLRDQLQRNQLGTSLVSTAFLPAAGIERYTALEQQQRKLRFVRIGNAALQDGISISEEETQTYYDDNQATFMSDEQVRVNYLQLNEEALLASVEVDEGALRGLYEESPDSYRAPESRQTRHILLKVADAASVEDEAIVSKAAEEVYARLGAGEDFAELAKSLSQDDLTAGEGGVLPEVFPGDLHISLERAVFSLPEGGFSAPVRTDAGYQIAQVDKIVGGGQQTFEEARSAVETEYRQREADARFGDISEELVNLSFEDSDIAQVAGDIGLELKQTDWISRRGGAGIAADPAIVEAAFSDRVFNLKENSDVIDMRDGSQVVMRFSGSKAPELIPLDAIRPQVETILKDQKSRAVAQSRGIAMVDALQGGGQLEELAAADQFEVETKEAVTRRSQDLEAAIVTQLFRMQAPDEGQATYSSLELSNGDQIVMALDGVTNPDSATPNQVVTDRVISGYGAREVEAYFEAMRGNANVSIIEENLIVIDQ